MKAILILASLAVAAILGSAKLLGSSRIPGLRLLARTGILFLLLGAIIGHNGLDILDEKTFKELGPIVVIGLGWLGFFFGTNLEFRTMRKFPKRLYVAAFSQAVITFGVVLAAFYGVGSYLQVSQPEGIIAATILAAAAAGTAPASLFMLGSERSIRSNSFEALRFFATVDDVPGLVALGLVFSFAPQMHLARLDSPIFWFCLQIILGVVFGFLLRALKLRGLDESAGDLVVFGVIGMSSGLCLYLHLSPLFVSAITGMTVVNVSEHSQEIYDRVASREHAFYVLFLLLSGCIWDYTGPALLVLAFIYVLVRLIGKVLGTAIAVQATPREWPMSGWGGFGLTSQGGLAIAMVVSYHWAFGRFLVDWAVGVVLLAVVINEVLAPWLETKFFRKLGDV